MSLQDDTAATTTQGIHLLAISDYCPTVICGLLVYEYLITLGREVEPFWKGKWTGAAALFYLNRYLGLLSNIYALVVDDHGDGSRQSCAVTGKTETTIQILQYLPWAAFSALRVLALSRSYPLAAFVFCLSIVPVVINLIMLSREVARIVPPLSGCAEVDNIPGNLSTMLTITSRASLIAGDLLLICITWASLYKRGTLRYVLAMNGFVAVLLRDGSIYFIVMLLLNILHLIEPLIPQSPALGNIAYAVQFWGPITTILISRFLLHLQAADRRASNPQGTTTMALHGRDGGAETPIFERVVGSLGASIDICTEDEDHGYVDSFGDDRDRVEDEGVLPTHSRSSRLQEGRTARVLGST